MRFPTVLMLTSSLIAGVLAVPVPGPPSTEDLDATHLPMHEQSTGHGGDMPNSNPLHRSARSPQLLAGQLLRPLVGIPARVKVTASLQTKRQGLSIPGNLPLSITAPQVSVPEISVPQPLVSVAGPPEVPG
ncbi:hypothetical protein BO99DRAFT_410503 [Aspergillus violaceofuscus CBS 115571]|uniref:Uncharacterized protein n=1 Tax=Aspergillus violaceofuscus (strain CBS 115571) TaxID=1450538 RepID=A0A2V5HBT0_ASPV1|nr:hypothetical protein BO99DRAFT_410503 [Aspergillus violaceofuscus CBS 115571]